MSVRLPSWCECLEILAELQTPLLTRRAVLAAQLAEIDTRLTNLDERERTLTDRKGKHLIK